MLFSWLVAIHRGSKGNTNRLLIGKVGKVGQRMAEAKGINPEITTEVTEEVKEITTEVAEEVKEAPSKLRQKLHELEAMWERASIQFFQAPKL